MECLSISHVSISLPAPDLVYLQKLLLNEQLSFIVSVVVVSRTLMVHTVLNVVSYFTSLLIHMTRFVNGDEKFGVALELLRI